MASPDEILRDAARVVRANPWMRGTLALRHVAAGDETALRAAKRELLHHLGHRDITTWDDTALNQALAVWCDQHTSAEAADLFDAAAGDDQPVIVQPAGPATGYAIPAPPKATEGARPTRDVQRAAALAVARLLTLDLPAASWALSAHDPNVIDGLITAGANEVVYRVASWGHHFAAVPRWKAYTTRSGGELSITVAGGGLTIKVWGVLPSAPPGLCADCQGLHPDDECDTVPAAGMAEACAWMPTKTPAPVLEGKRDGRRTTTPTGRRVIPWRGGPRLDPHGEHEYERERADYGEVGA